MPVIGLDLGATKLASALFDDAGAILHHSQSELAGRTGDSVATLLLDHLQRHREQARAAGLNVAGVGVSVPGIARHATGTVWAPNIDGWDDFPLRDRLTSAAPAVPLAIDSDRACSILAEVERGAARGCRDAIFLAVGTGIGAGILIDGRLLRGAHDIAGAIGWMALDRPYRLDYDACGCFETHASGAGIERAAQAAVRSAEAPRSCLSDLPTDAITTRAVFDAALDDDPLATRLIDTAIECWGMAIANLVSLFNPEVIILGGGVFGPAAVYVDRIVDEAKRWAQPVSIGLVSIRVTELGPNACLLGTGQLALQAACSGSSDVR